MESANEHVTGEVTVKLYKGSATVVARSSPYALYDQTLAWFGESGGEFSQEASPGFIELFTLQSRMAHRVRDARSPGRRLGKIDKEGPCFNDLRTASAASSSASPGFGSARQIKIAGGVLAALALVDRLPDREARAARGRVAGADPGGGARVGPDLGGDLRLLARARRPAGSPSPP